MLVPAIDHQNLTSDEACSVAEEEYGSISDIPHITNASGWNCEESRLIFASLGAETTHTLCATDGAGSNYIRTHSLK